MRKKLLEKRAALLAECEVITTKAETENRPMTDDERTQVRSKLDEAKLLVPQIKDAEELELASEETRTALGVIDKGAIQRSRGTVPAVPGAAEDVHDNAEDKPFGQVDSAGKMVGGGLGDFLKSVARHAISRGRDFDPRLRKLDIQDLKVRAAAGMSEDVASDGGFLVFTDVGAPMAKTIFDTGALASRTSKIPLGPNFNGIKIPYVDETSRANGSRWGGVRTYWLNEATAPTATKPKFGLLQLNLHKVAGLVYLTDEMLQDAVASESYVKAAITDELAFAVDDAIIRGPGAGTPLGVLNAPCTVSVAKETSQTAATILYANVSKMRQRMTPRSFANAVWYINVDCQPQLEQMSILTKNVAGTENVSGWPAYLPPGGASQMPYGMLFGRPVIPIEQCETVGTVGDIMLLDLGMYWMTTKGGVQQASSIHVNFLTDEVAYRFILRTDGQPALRSAITPYKGTGTLSPFITLATRS